MAPIRSLLAAGLLFLSTANAHFELLQPPSLEGDKMNEELEGNAPCGGGVPDLSKNTATDFHVDGDSIAVLLGHPQADWLFRATLDSKAAGNWSELYPIFTQSGRGNLCQPTVKAPKEWVGKKGIIGVACNAPDGILYQCAAVNFVAGASTTPGSSCTNGSMTANFNSVPALAALVGESSSTPSSNPSSTSSPSAAASTSKSAAASLLVVAGSSPIGSLAATAAMVLVGVALL
ncbi:hypothetical protein C8A05DRAFT_33087 [Staphylotrichum tortipilum]|uniref:Copper acquisition factor BIM1-like domain-containing protein n=1 Tax=Staphylotrichum tortipilum TaxID=2831512 RepID=A0AAN6MLL8_9PEZI|nr:hypothetical protein C8A05DRAFT_33087 [Staphylotrichum longicolle]